MKHTHNVLAFFSILISTPYTLQAHKKPFIVLSAHGDALTAGRTIKHELERDLAHNFVHTLGKKLQLKKRYTLALTHEKTDAPGPLNLVSLINKFDADLLVKIHVCHEPSAKPHLSLYFLTYNPLTDMSYRQLAACSLIPFKRAHTMCPHRTKHFARTLKDLLEKSPQSTSFSLNGPSGVPLISLSGITCPAIILELGINSPDQLKQLVKPVAKGITLLIQTDKKQNHSLA